MEEDDTPEFQAIENLTDYLEKFLGKPENKLINFLTKEGFISKTDSDELRDVKSRLTAADKGGMIVQAISESVQRDKNLFHKLVQTFSKSGPFYKACTEKLTSEYAKCSGGGGNVSPAAVQLAAGRGEC